MRILTVLTYYRPHTSGLTIYAERLAQALVARGHQVTVLTTQFEKDLPLEEMKDGVRIKRLPVLLRVSKGVISPSFGRESLKEVRAHDVVLLHLPQFDAAGVAGRARLFKKPCILIYHCDLTLPPSLFNRLVNMVVHFMNFLAGISVHRISAYTEDFANHSPYLQRFKNKVRVVSPAVVLPQAKQAEVAAFAQEHNPKGRGPVIAMATRFAAEKGVEVLLKALPQVLEKYPQAMVWFAGQYQDVLGEEAYLRRLMPEIERYQAQGQWKFLGVLNLQQMAAFYPNIDLLIVPSTNSTETFGFVQIEAMMNGKPVVASNLPGVRQPVTITGMGRVSPIGDAQALGENMLAVLDNPKEYQGDPDKLRQQFSPEINAVNHEALYREIAEELGVSLPE